MPAASSRSSTNSTIAMHTPMIAAAISSMFFAPIDSTRNARERRAHRAAEARATADEAEQPLGLPRIVDVVGQRPELADQQHRQDQPDDVERDRDPVLRRSS